MSYICQASESLPVEYISQLSKIITEDFLHISDRSISSRGLEILHRLESYYKEEGCEPTDNDNPDGLKSEKQFILRSLPYISSVIQLSSTIQHFNDAMEQIEKIYDLEEKPFDQAIILSYIVFVEVVNRGYQYFLGDTSPPDYEHVKVAEGVKKREQPPATREALWLEMKNQLQNLLRDKLKLPSNGQKGFPWYTLARRHSRQALAMFEELDSQLKAMEKLEEKSIIESEIRKTKAEIKTCSKEILENLRIAKTCGVESKFNQDKILILIRDRIQAADKDFDEIRNDPMFKELVEG